MLRCEEITVSFGSTRALDRVSLSIGAGESVSIMGASGSGKSTLLQCLAGLRAPGSGGVWFEGQALHEMSEKRRSQVRLRDFGFVFQFGELVPELSLLENVALPVWMGGASRSEANRQAAGALERFGIADLAGRRPSDVSGGEQQRAAVARALAHSPKVVFADEPTGALDSVNAQTVLEALTDQARAQGSAVVMVTHEARLASFCDREIIVRDGAVVGDDLDARLAAGSVE